MSQYIPYLRSSYDSLFLRETARKSAKKASIKKDADDDDEEGGGGGEAGEEDEDTDVRFTAEDPEAALLATLAVRHSALGSNN